LAGPLGRSDEKVRCSESPAATGRGLGDQGPEAASTSPSKPALRLLPWPGGSWAQASCQRLSAPPARARRVQAARRGPVGPASTSRQRPPQRAGPMRPHGPDDHHDPQSPPLRLALARTLLLDWPWKWGTECASGRCQCSLSVALGARRGPSPSSRLIPVGLDTFRISTSEFKLDRRPALATERAGPVHRSLSV
jgi:hypothetical protein